MPRPMAWPLALRWTSSAVPLRLRPLNTLPLFYVHLPIATEQTFNGTKHGSSLTGLGLPMENIMRHLALPVAM